MEIRNELLHLHKTLLEIEREIYESQNGKVTNLKLLNLLFEEDSFRWLREISILVAEIDECLASKTGIDAQKAKSLIGQVKSLFDESQDQQRFKQLYQVHLEREFSVTVHQEKLSKLLAKEKA